ncbi:helicase [Phenylobacterium sp. SCN 70-31]|uniref:helicase n=1 Tax=Phenylobacterium sp. SCN 70-31 TaxID=1660129 RepID=UPI000A4E5BB7|nr:helicase [Phenylobacterium sp. SCN 70-31]
MDSRQKAGDGNVRLPALSRRAVLAGTSIAAFGAAKPGEAASTPSIGAPVPSDEGTRRCANWLALNAKIERLQSRWARLESWLVKNHAWCKLSPAEQQALPWAKELRDIDGCLDLLFEQREALLQSIPATGSISLDSVVARLAVVERLIWREEHPEVYALVTGARRDLIALSRGQAPAVVSQDPAAL